MRIRDSLFVNDYTAPPRNSVNVAPAFRNPARPSIRTSNGRHARILPRSLSMSRAFDRRQFLLSLPALALAPKVLAQSNGAPIRVRGINHVTLTVSDLKRSTEFYQGL